MIAAQRVLAEKINIKPVGCSPTGFYVVFYSRRLLCLGNINIVLIVIKVI